MDLTTFILRKFSFVRGLERQILRLRADGEARASEKEELRAEMAKWTRYSPHGHFYSPLSSPEDIAAAFRRRESGPPFPAIEFNEAAQFALFREIVSYRNEFPFRATPAPGRRYPLANTSYSPYDAFILYGMIRHLQPSRIIEVGCGYSSAAMLDLNDGLFEGRLRLTFIDPDLAEFRRHALPGDETRSTLIEKPVQDVPTEVFSSLEANDVLFLDTSHISKVGSDVNHLFFTVLPALKPGVWVHIHDVCADLEYPRGYFDEGRAWNEIYLLRAFLMYNRTFEIMLSSAFLYDHRLDLIREQLPALAAGGGCQMWLRKLEAPQALEGLQPTAIPASGGAGPVSRGAPEPVAGAHQASRLVNCSARGSVGPRGKVVSCGFSVGGPLAKTVLIRAVGPGLASAGVAGALARPRLQVFDSNPGRADRGPQIIASIQGWGMFPKVGPSTVDAIVLTATASAMAGVGAFALETGSADSAMILTLPPGTYTAEVSGLEEESGAALVEIYEMP
jgi:predicted O-methyltransferase YrrM